MTKIEKLHKIFDIIDQNITQKNLEIVNHISMTFRDDLKNDLLIEFKGMTSLTLDEYISKRRRQKIAEEIAKSNASITDIASNFGMGSSSMSNIMKKYLDLTPMEIRNKKPVIPDIKREILNKIGLDFDSVSIPTTDPVTKSQSIQGELTDGNDLNSIITFDSSCVTENNYDTPHDEVNFVSKSKFLTDTIVIFGVLSIIALLFVFLWKAEIGGAPLFFTRMEPKEHIIGYIFFATAIISVCCDLQNLNDIGLHKKNEKISLLCFAGFLIFAFLPAVFS